MSVITIPLYDFFHIFKNSEHRILFSYKSLIKDEVNEWFEQHNMIPEFHSILRNSNGSIKIPLIGLTTDIWNTTYSTHDMVVFTESDYILFKLTWC